MNPFEPKASTEIPSTLYDKWIVEKYNHNELTYEDAKNLKSKIDVGELCVTKTTTLILKEVLGEQ